MIILLVSMGTNWEFWAVIIGSITLALIVGRILWDICKSIKRKRQLNDPFETYYERKLGKIEYSYIGFTSPKPQQVKITLRMKTTVNVEHIWIRFEGKGNIPKIKKLYEWNKGYGKILPTAYQDRNIEDKRYFWNYYHPSLRGEQDKIRIGIECQAPSYFKGNLVIGLKTIETRKIDKLSFEIKNG